MDHVKEFYRFIDCHKRVPTYRELVDVWGYKTKSAVDYRIKKLVAEGSIGKVGGRLVPRDGAPAPAASLIADGNAKNAPSGQH
jgi:hypothetical protein